MLAVSDRVTKLLSSETQGPNNSMLSIHLVMVALVICKECADKETMLFKVRQLFELICFVLIEGQVQKTEVRYVYHLVELWIAAVSSGSLPSASQVTAVPAVQDQMESLEEQIFPNEEDEMATIDAVCAYIEGHHETLSLISLFQNISITGSRRSIRSQVSLQRASQPDISPEARRGIETNMSAESNKRSVKNPSILRQSGHKSQFDLSMKKREDEDNFVTDQVVVVEVGQLMSSKRQRTSSEDSKEKGEEVDHSSSADSEHVDGEHAKPGDEEVKSPLSRKTIQATSPTSGHSKGGPYSPGQAQVLSFGADLDLHWTTDVIQRVISAYSIKLGHYEHERLTLNRM